MCVCVCVRVCGCVCWYVSFFLCLYLCAISDTYMIYLHRSYVIDENVRVFLL